MESRNFILVLFGIVVLLLFFAYAIPYLQLVDNYEYNNTVNSSSNGSDNTAYHLIDSEKDLFAMYRPIDANYDESIYIGRCEERGFESVNDVINRCDFNNGADIQNWNISYQDGFFRKGIFITDSDELNGDIENRVGSNFSILIEDTNYTNTTNPYYINTTYTYESHYDWNTRLNEDIIRFLPALIIAFIGIFMSIVLIFIAKDGG